MVPNLMERSLFRGTGTLFVLLAVLLSIFFSFSAKVFILLPPDCRGKNETGCLLLHRLDYIFIWLVSP